MPDQLAKIVVVQFLPSQREALALDPAIFVSVEQLERAVLWLATHNYEWLTAAAAMPGGRLILASGMDFLLRA